MANKLHIKKDDLVKVIAGDHKGQEGRVLSVDRAKNRVIVEGVNMISRHVKPSAANPQGGIEKREAAIHISNLMIVHGGEPTRVGRKANDDGKLVRYAKKSGEVIS